MSLRKLPPNASEIAWHTKSMSKNGIFCRSKRRFVTFLTWAYSSHSEKKIDVFSWSGKVFDPFWSVELVPVSAMYVYDNIGLVCRGLFPPLRLLYVRAQVGNIIASPRLIFISQENWFGFVALSNDGKEVTYLSRVDQIT